MDYFSVRNFEELQHYSNRPTNPWIRIYLRILRDPDVNLLPERFRFRYIALLILAAETDNKIPADSKWLRGRLNCSRDLGLWRLAKWLIPHGDHASKMLEKRYPQIQMQIQNHSVTEKLPSPRKARAAPRKRGPHKNPHSIDAALTRLIDGFRQHPDRESAYVPRWDRDKKLLRPYLLTKGEARTAEMLSALIHRHQLLGESNGNFNRKCILDSPVSIPGFCNVAERMDEVFTWDSQEVPYDQNQRGSRGPNDLRGRLQRGEPGSLPGL